MAFKSIEAVKKELHNGKFILENNGDYADVVLMYRSRSEVLTADVHYIKSNEYSGYVHHIEGGCPACTKQLRIQNKLFVPMYVLAINGAPVNELQFWDRHTKFDQTLQTAVFTHYSNPSEVVFRITRNGVAGDINTTYSIIPLGMNTVAPFDAVLASLGTKFPDAYERVVKSVDAATLGRWLTAGSTENTAMYGGLGGLPEYQAIPRVTPPVSNVAASLENLPEIPATASAPVTTEAPTVFAAASVDNDGVEDEDLEVDEPDFD